MTHRPKKNLSIERSSAFARLGHETLDQLGNTRSRTYFGVDTVFTLGATDTLAWDWLRCRQRGNVSSATLQLSELTRPHRTHRLVLAQAPEDITNPFLQNNYRNRLRLFLHMHLRDGAAVYISFLRNSHLIKRTIQQSMNFAMIFDSCMRKFGQLYRFPELWLNSFAGMEEVTKGHLAIAYCDRVWETLRDKETIAVWYEPIVFEARRFNTALWQRLRRLVYRIDCGVCQATGCGKYAAFAEGEVDHTVPIKKSNNLLPNLRWLCGPCNRRKSCIETFERPMEDCLRILPTDVDDTESRQAVGDEAPNWLGRYRDKPRFVTSILGF